MVIATNYEGCFGDVQEEEDGVEYTYYARHDA
jgi:hypothetical protein